MRYKITDYNENIIFEGSAAETATFIFNSHLKWNECEITCFHKGRWWTIDEFGKPLMPVGAFSVLTEYIFS